GLFVGSADLKLSHSVFTANMADISGGGLYVTGEVPANSRIFNCLFDSNVGRRDGGGASVNWFAVSSFANCTFANNSSTGRGGTYSDPGSGGGLYCAYGSNVSIIDSIFWGNNAAEGKQITVGTGYIADPRPATLSVSYSDIQGSTAATAIKVGTGSTLNWGTGNINADPLFVKHPDNLGDYFLALTSPCISVGSAAAGVIGLDTYTTNILGTQDKGIVDLGYHYFIQQGTSTCRTMDLILNGRIEMADMLILAGYWLNACNDLNTWCGGSDFNYDASVDFDDMAILSRCWLEEDSQAPVAPLWRTTNPIVSTFNTHNQLVLYGQTTTDDWIAANSIEYRFAQVTYEENPNTGNLEEKPTPLGDWMNESMYLLGYTVSNLNYATVYQYRILAKDMLGNESQSVIMNGTPGTQYYPQPDPLNPVVSPVMQWTTLPAPVDQTRITMTALQIADPYNLGMEYEYQRFVGPAAVGSPAATIKVQNIIQNPGTPNVFYSTTPWIFTDAGLVDGQVYTYRVRCRYGNALDAWTLLSVAASATPQIVDYDPPLPNPAVLTSATKVSVNGIWYHLIVAQEAADASDVEYQFECVVGNALKDENAMWRNAGNMADVPNNPNGTAPTPNVIWVRVDSQFVGYQYRVRYRDRSPLQNMGQWSEPLQAQ
ncbi:MAG TPA: hypothetical protein PKB02_17990, partial [Anaerohalosphaeraceae bacterium]|nr:hypothetical protein [Anaerohalosphaeraceae bacterium]